MHGRSLFLKTASSQTLNGNLHVTGELYSGESNPAQLNVSGEVKVGTAITIGTAGIATVGVNTSTGLVLTSANGTKYRLFVENDGSLKTAAN